MMHCQFIGNFPILHIEAVENAGSLFGTAVASNEYGSHLGYLHETKTSVSLFVFKI